VFEREGILVDAVQIRLLAEEAPYAYENIDEVIEACNEIHLSKKVTKMMPIIVGKR
jgi:RNA-splicing ligase RtcB